jgi:hypothetical protein
VSTNVNLTPGPSPKERGVDALKSVNCAFKICTSEISEKTPVTGSPLLWRGAGGEVKKKRYV